MPPHGVGSVDGWLTRVIAGELGVAASADDSLSLDADLFQAAIGPDVIGLSPIEFGVLQHLSERAEQTVSRAELLDCVWPEDSDATSNVVEVAVRSLRRKLGDHAKHITTVRGRGYRYLA